MKTKIEVEISNDVVTGLKRKLIHNKLIIDSNLEMKESCLIRYYLNDNGAYGLPVIDSILANTGYTLTQKQRLVETYQDVEVIVTTENSIVDPSTGQPTKNENGISELLFWQNLPLSIVDTSSNKCSDIIYQLMSMSLANLDARKTV